LSSLSKGFIEHVNQWLTWEAASTRVGSGQTSALFLPSFATYTPTPLRGPQWSLIQFKRRQKEDN